VTRSKETFPLVEAVHTGTFDGADMDEHILATVGRLDKAKSLLAVEPFYGSLRHQMIFLSDYARIARMYSTALSHGPFKSRFGEIISPTQSARQGQRFRPKLDHSRIKVSLPEYK
jgi:hypothetical protein